MSNASDFIIENGVLTKYIGPGGDVVIPDGVTGIGKEAFQGCTNVTSIVIPKGVTKIGSSAFRDCTGLINVVIPKGVTRIGENQFENCTSLTKIDIPKGVTGIANAAFRNCTNLFTVILPAGLTSIGYYVFSDCKNLANIDIPTSMTSIGNIAFHGCVNLTSIVIPEKVTYIGQDAFLGCEKLKKIKIPTRLGAHLKNFLEVSDGLRIHITDLNALQAKYRSCAALCFAEDGGCFEDPRFESHSKYLIANAGKLVDLAVKEPALLALLCREKWIAAKDADAFFAAAQQTGNAEVIALMMNYQNTKLTDKEKEKEQMRRAKEENIVFSRAAARLNQEGIEGLIFVLDGDLHTFVNKEELKEMITQKGGKLQTSISAKTDYLVKTNLQGNTAKQKKAAELGVEVITERQLNDKLGRSFAVKSGVLTEYLGASDNVVIPNRVTSIDQWAFNGSPNLTSVTIPESVTSIGECAFWGCNDLTSITIPESVTSIGHSAFKGCEKLSDANGFVIVKGKLFHYSGPGGDVVIPKGVTHIDDGAFCDCTSLTSVIIPEGVTEIGNRAFSKCTNLISIVIPPSLTGIDTFAFGNCTNLTSINVPEGATVGNYAFYGCKKLGDAEGFVIAQRKLFDYSGDGGNVIIPDGVTEIGGSTFEGCVNLTGVAIPKSVTSIGKSAFKGCEKLASIVIPEGVTSIGYEAFNGCASLTNIAIPEGVTSIGDHAFEGCKNLTSIVIPAGVTSIGFRMFEHCENLTNIVIPESVTSIDNWAFWRHEKLTIRGVAGSYAEQYAKENNIPFAAE